MKLFYFPNSCSLASHIALEEIGVQYVAERVNFVTNQQRGEAYLKINPKGRVPALVCDRGVLTETPAILAYLAQAYPAAQLAPVEDPFAFAQVQAFNSYLCSTVHVAHAHRMRGHRWADDPTAIEEMKRKVPETMSACFALIEHELMRGPWVMGAAYTICDPYLFTVSRWAIDDAVELARFPKVSAHFKRMSSRPSVVTALAQEGA